MITKDTIYPKTARVPYDGEDVVLVTEKMDGSNLTIFKYEDELYIAQRKNIFKWVDKDSLKSYSNILYGKLTEWLIENGDDLRERMNNGSVIIGEWMGMSRVRADIDSMFMMFAKANVFVRDNDKFTIKNLKYNDDTFIHPFIDKIIPEYIDIIPIIGKLKHIPSVRELDTMYDGVCRMRKYTPEGFIVSYDDVGMVLKYVRSKRGRIEPHTSNIDYLTKKSKK